MVPKMGARFQHLTTRIKEVAIIMSGSTEWPDLQKVMELLRCL